MRMQLEHKVDLTERMLTSLSSSFDLSGWLAFPAGIRFPLAPGFDEFKLMFRQQI
jgi:hypothetical protein